MTTATVEIHPLSPARLADFMAFFEGEAFSDNQKWSFCYCQCFYEDHSKVHWASRTAVENRECASQRIAQGRMQGLLAYHKGEVVGWCNAAPRELLHALDAEPIANPEQVGTIVCFSLRQTLEVAALQPLCSTLHANISEHKACCPWKRIRALARKEQPRTILALLACTSPQGSRFFERMRMEASGWAKSFNRRRSVPRLTPNLAFNRTHRYVTSTGERGYRRAG